VKKLSVLHSGHIGDIIAFLPLYEDLGATKLYITDNKYIPNMLPMNGFKYATLEPLLKNIGVDVEFVKDPDSVDINIDTTKWQVYGRYYSPDMNLLEQQAFYLGIIKRNERLTINDKWIDVDPDPATKGRVVFNRTSRYRNYNFSWKDVRKYFGDRALFIGTDAEYKLFKKEVGTIERYKVDDCLQIARAIAGSDYFVGNQSSSFWIAAAMRHPLLQEVCLSCPNSIINNENATYYTGGKLNINI
jgi:hypothetical protein